ncbi:hypothetical protein [Ruminococcus sp.]|uniref:hypothetical protein n=1 Tax=Ruminococcus sp. TaxID=41978 RepID=UPI00386D0A16
MDKEKTALFIGKPKSVTFDLIGVKFPSTKDVYFRAKQEEIIEQYRAARIFMYETETDDWEHWFKPVENPMAQTAFQHYYRSYFYEAALFYYNSLVDVSWALCYVSVEYACQKQGKFIDISGIKPIEEAFDNLRKIEGNTTSPTAENNPFEYFKLMCPEFDKMTCEEIASIENVSVNAIKKGLKKAQKRIQDILSTANKNNE